MRLESFVAFKEKLKDKHRKFVRISGLRKYPHTPSVVCCYLLSFICGYHEYGTESILTILIDAIVPPVNGDVQIAWSYPLSLWVLGLSYTLFSIPIGYILGQKIGHRWSMVLGQSLMYLYGFSSSVFCGLYINCITDVWFLAVLPLFMLGFVVMNVNFILLALEQVGGVCSDAKSAFINWLWFFFFLGRGSTVFLTSTILFWSLPVYGFVIKIGFAVIGVSLLIWMPFDGTTATNESVSSTISRVYKVCKEALKTCRCRCKKHIDEPETHYRQREFPIDHRPNMFERASQVYGGPLPLEDVRGVLKFFLISFMLCSHIGILIIYSIMYSAYSMETSKTGIPASLLIPSRSNISLAADIVYNEVGFPMGWISVIADLTTILSIAVLNLFVYKTFPDRFTLNNRIIIGTVFAFLTSLSSVVTESTRSVLANNHNDTMYLNGFSSLKNSPTAVYTTSQNMPLFSCVPQYMLYGIMTAFIIPATSDLAGVSAPIEFSPLLFGVYFTVMGVSMTAAGFIMFVQMAPGSIWCFFCGDPPRTGVMTFVITTLIAAALFVLYLLLARLFKKIESAIDPRYNTSISRYFGQNQHTFTPPQQDEDYDDQ